MTEEELAETAHHYSSLPRCRHAGVALGWDGRALCVWKENGDGVCRIVPNGRYFDQYTIYDPDDGEEILGPHWLREEKPSLHNCVSRALWWLGA